MDKVISSAAKAVSDVVDGSIIAIGGFSMGHCFPSSLILALRDKGSKDLCVVCNSLGAPGELRGNILAENEQISRLIAAFTSRPGQDTASSRQIAEGQITYELVPQGILVERMRAAGAGIPAFYSPTAVGTLIAEGKEEREFDGRTYILERALPVDFAFVRAAIGDREGNLRFHGTSRNFNYSFAKAARFAIAEVDQIVEVGEIPPDDVDLPGVFISRVVQSTVEVNATDRPPRRRRAADTGRDYNGKPALLRTEIAKRAAGLVLDGAYVNLGSGMPTLLGNHLRNRDVTLHSENGMLGVGEIVTGDEIDPDVFNAGGGFVKARPGASYFDSVTSFEMVRSGKIDVVVLGAFQVDSEANIANWSTPDMVGGGIGGAMDLVAGGGTLIVVMEHCDSKGRPKLLEHCDYPLTGKHCVSMVVTDLAVLRREGDLFVLDEYAPGFSPEEVAEFTGFQFEVSANVTSMRL